MPKKEQKNENGAVATASKPSGQALQAVDVAVGAVPQAADTVSKTVEVWRKSDTRSKELETLQNRVSNLRDSKTRSSELETLRKRLADEIERAGTRGGDVRKQVTDQLIGQARKARERVEPVYRERVEPVYRERLEPTVKRVRERI
jgi:hypothetical protein